MNRTRNGSTVASIVALVVLGCATSAVASDVGSEPTPPPLRPPLVYDDPAGDAGAGAPDLLSCAVSEPWESLLSFQLEFASDPPLSYDLETMTTDELWVMLLSGPEADLSGDAADIVYAMIVHGATMPYDEETGSGLYDTTQPEGEEVFWRVVDVAVDGPVLTLSVDRKLVGDPDAIYFAAAVSSEGQDQRDGGYDVCPDEDAGAGEYRLAGR